MIAEPTTPETPATDDAPATAAPVNQAPSAVPEARALLQKLQTDSITFREFKPVAIGIDKVIAERYPEFSRRVVRIAMRQYTASTRYLKSLEKAAFRYDFDGNEAGEVPEDHRTHARDTLKQRFTEAAKRKRERERADSAARKAEEAERKRDEKLQQLVGRFAKH